MRRTHGLMICTLVGLFACNTDAQDDDPWWDAPEYNVDDTDSEDTDSKDTDGGDKGVPDCPDDFDPKQPCTGDPKSSACIFDNKLYYCDGEKWVVYDEGK